MKPMSTPLIDALVERHGFGLVTEANVDAFLDAHEQSLLFFPGDPDRLVESNDAAVIVAELMKQFSGRLAPALVERASERRLQQRFRFKSFPAFVFLRRQGYLGVITGLLDWQDYFTAIEAILAREPSEPPPFELPEAIAARLRAAGADNHDHSGEVA
jgi:hydrogenase-1 operon protein HyaE